MELVSSNVVCEEAEAMCSGCTDLAVYSDEDILL